MAIYFGFSDECGDYRPNMGRKSLQRHPYYIRSTLLIDASEWKGLRKAFIKLKNKFGLDINREVKWAYLWNLRYHHINQLEIPYEKPYKYLENVDYHDLINFVENALLLLKTLSFKKIIITATENRSNRSTNEKSMLGMHLQEHMQRIEMELANDDENLGILFFDPVNNKKNFHFRELYNELFTNGDYIKEYSHIKDSLNIEESHHSVGIQITDFICGSFSAFMKSGTGSNYDRGVDMFYESIYPFLRRREADGKICGYGIREVPRSIGLREKISGKISDLEIEKILSM